MVIKEVIECYFLEIKSESSFFILKHTISN